jgi:hypothetical protein
LLICSYFTTIPGGRAGWRAGAGGNKIKANSAQLNLAGAWAELGNSFSDIEILGKYKLSASLTIFAENKYFL